MSSPSSARSGFLAGGNFIVDTAKIIDTWPEQDALATILETRKSNGGGPYNFLKNVARLAGAISRDAIGLLGNDAEADWILKDCRDAGIGIESLTIQDGLTTSLTDVMTVAGTGRRTFFHSRGANAHLDVHHFDFSETTARIFYLGYLALLDRMDQLDVDGSTGASKVLRAARQSGMVAAVDCVSTDHPQFREIAAASLAEADVFFLNEVEASIILGKHIGADDVESAINEIVDIGARGTIVLHMPRGVYAACAGGEPILRQPSLDVPNQKIVGTSGAGDAFSAGYLYGIHEGRTTCECLNYGVCVAAMSLFAATPSDGLGTIKECLALSDKFGYV